MPSLLQLWLNSITWLSGYLTPILSFLHVSDDPRQVAEAVLVTAVQIGVIVLIFRPLEDIVPAERWPDRRLTRIDRLYTLLMLLGLLPLFSYVVLSPVSNLFEKRGVIGEATFGVKHWIPWFDHHPLLLVAVYYLIYDFVYYWMHRAEHLIPWLWALHSVHHSQRQVSCWTDDRDSYLSGAMEAMVLAGVGLVMCVDIADFAWLALASELIQKFSHTNARIGFGRYLEKIFVDPTFHRLHHMKADPARPALHNCNFGQAFSVWDVLFRTALYGEPVHPTGVCDPVVDADNERDLIAMQWNALKRFWGAIRRPSGWRPGDVTFGPRYEPIHEQIGHASVQRGGSVDTTPVGRTSSHPVSAARADGARPTVAGSLR